MKARQRRIRLDELLVARGLASSVQKAQAIILAGEVFVNGERVSKSGTPIAGDAPVEIHTRASNSKAHFATFTSTRPAAFVSTSALPREASPIACSSTAQPASTLSTSRSIRLLGNCARTPA
jgi:ribosomal protein S4